MRTFEFYAHVFCYGTMKELPGKRSYIVYNNDWFPFARVLWNIENPENLALPRETVHHKDKDCTNEAIENLEKCNIDEHDKYHFRDRKQPKRVYGRKIELMILNDQNNSFSHLPRSFQGWFTNRVFIFKGYS